MNTNELMQATGATPRQVTWWLHRGWITPENGRHGSGRPLEWSAATADRCRVLVIAAQLQALPLGDLAELVGTGRVKVPTATVQALAS